MKFRYLLIDDSGDVTGTNSEAVARQAADNVADNGYQSVVDTEAGLELIGTGTYPIPQQETFSEG